MLESPPYNSLTTFQFSSPQLFLNSLWVRSLFALFINFTVVLPAYGVYAGIWGTFYRFIPSLVISILFLYCQKYVIQYFFFHEKDQRSFQLLNKKGFAFYEYFLFVPFTLLGVLSYIVRLVISFVLIILNFSRLDRTFMVSGAHWMDSGYTTYLSNLLVDAYYGNPILISFCRLSISRRSRGSKPSDDALRKPEIALLPVGDSMTKLLLEGDSENSPFSDGMNINKSEILMLKSLKTEVLLANKNIRARTRWMVLPFTHFFCALFSYLYS